jgi:hypothetical protein
MLDGGRNERDEGSQMEEDGDGEEQETTENGRTYGSEGEKESQRNEEAGGGKEKRCTESDAGGRPKKSGPEEESTGGSSSCRCYTPIR